MASTGDGYEAIAILIKERSPSFSDDAVLLGANQSTGPKPSHKRECQTGQDEQRSSPPLCSFAMSSHPVYFRWRRMRCYVPRHWGRWGSRRFTGYKIGSIAAFAQIDPDRRIGQFVSVKLFQFGPQCVRSASDSGIFSGRIVPGTP